MAGKRLIHPDINPSILAGALMAASLLGLIALPDLRGAYTPTFLALFFIASGGYILAILRQDQDHLEVKWIFGLAILFRLILLFSPPSLSDDVYRYAWDGHLMNQGLNPYAFPVNSPALDALEIPLRELVNHNWMASPYLPASQLVFAITTFLAPQQILAFQVAAVLFDLSAGWLVFDILRRIGLSPRNVLVYLWNPLVIVEFAQGAHVDAVMIFLMMLAFWLLVRKSRAGRGASTGSVVALAAATLTKFIPILLAPILWWRWQWKQRILFVVLLLGALAVFIPGAGLGLLGPLDGTGIFGALRIYLQQWNYNGGIYHWLEVLISGYPTPGAVPVEAVGQTPIFITKAITTFLLGCVVLIASWLAWRSENTIRQHPDSHVDQYPPETDLTLIRLGMLSLGAFLLFSATIHPWYVTVIVPFLPFLYSKAGEPLDLKPMLWPWAYFSVIVALSYLTYLDPQNLRETTWVRLVEYLPFYGLLGWAAWKIIKESKKSMP